MKKYIELNTDDMKEILANQFNVEMDAVEIQCEPKKTKGRTSPKMREYDVVFKVCEGNIPGNI